MNLYDIISQIAQKQCDKLYETKLAVGKLDLQSRKFTLNNLQIDFEDLFFSDTVCEKLLESSTFYAICIQAQNRIFILDKLGEL